MTTPHSTDALKQDDCRAEFEAWALAEKVAYRDEQHGICFYDGSARAHQWIGWQAAWNRRPTPASPDLADWHKLFDRVALALNCLPSSYVDGNEHVIKAAEKRAEAAAGAVPEGFALVPIHATNAITCAIERQIDSQLTASGMDANAMFRQDGDYVWDAAIAAAIAAAPPAQGLPAAPDDPDDDPAFCAWIKDYRITESQKWLAWGAWCRGIESRIAAAPKAAPSEPTLEGVNLDVIARSYGLYR